MKRKREKPGLTLVEILTVIAIVALLIGILMPAATAVKNAAKEVKQRGQFMTINLALAAWNGLQIVEAPVGVVYQTPQKQVSHFKPGLAFWRNTKTFARLIMARALIPHGLRVRKNLKS